MINASLRVFAPYRVPFNMILYLNTIPGYYITVTFGADIWINIGGYSSVDGINKIDFLMELI